MQPQLLGRPLRDPLSRHLGQRLARLLLTACLLLAVLAPLGPLRPRPLWAAPVSWREVAPSLEGRQWWDEGSLRLSRDGWLSVLSRFQPAAKGELGTAPTGSATSDAETSTEARPRSSELYAMEMDCDQRLYRDTAVNGLPRFRPQWQPAGGDALITEVLEEACAAAAPLLAAR
jgi:hypothetical protein